MFNFNLEKISFVVETLEHKTINPLTPGNHTTIVRIQHEEASIARTNAYLDYNIIPLIDYEVTFDLILLEGLDQK